MTALDQKFVEEVLEWTEHNFEPNYDACVWGTIEEFGELMRCLTKIRQGIRGSRQEWEEELGKEAGDVIIKLVQVMDFHGMSLSDCLEERWETVSKRDWKANPIGHGIN